LRELEQLLLADFLPAEERQTNRGRRGDPIARCRDPKGNTSHFVETIDNVLLGIGFHDALDNLAGLICGPVLKKSHLTIFDFRFWILDSGAISVVMQSKI
jgi:hypothetical protein